MRVEVYEDETGRRPFNDWFNALPPNYATKVLLARGRIEAKGLLAALNRWARGSTSGGSTGALACASISPSTESASSCCWAEAPSDGSRLTSAPLDLMGGLPETQGQEERMFMPLSREFNQTIRERAERDPAFRLAMLQDALSALDVGEAFDAKILLRDFINATVGFPPLGEATGRIPRA